MTIIKSQGYNSDTIDDVDWAVMHPYIGLSRYGVATAADWKVTATAGTRMLSIAPGYGWGQGVRDYNDAPVLLDLPAAPSGSLWYLISCQRDWSAKASSFVRSDTGGSAKQVPTRPVIQADGTGNDLQPLALVQVGTGPAIAAIVDLRVVAGDGGLIGFDDLTLQYMNRPGTAITLPSGRWVRTYSPTGTLQWERPDQIADTGLKTSAAGVFSVNTSGWALGGILAQIKGGILSTYVEVKRTGGTITPGVDGNIANVRLGTFSSAWRVGHHQPAHSGATGRIASGYLLPDGSLNLAAVTPGDKILTGDYISMGGTFLV